MFLEMFAERYLSHAKGRWPPKLTIAGKTIDLKPPRSRAGISLSRDAKKLRDTIELIFDRQFVCCRDLNVARSLEAIVDGLENLADFFDRKAARQRNDAKSVGNNVDRARRIYFYDVLWFWESLLKRKVTTGYKEGVGPQSKAVDFIAACARPVIGNDKASLDSIRHFLRAERVWRRVSQKKV